MPRSLTLIVMIALCDAAAAQSGGPSVRTRALAGTHIYDVAVATTDAAVAYAATQSGIFKTTSRGRIWTKVREGSTNLIVLGARENLVVAGVVAEESKLKPEQRENRGGGQSPGAGRGEDDPEARQSEHERYRRDR